MGVTFIVFMVLLFLGTPVAFALALSGTLFFLSTPEIPLTILVQKSLSQTQSFTMLAVPLFIFAGNLMNNTGITHRLIKLSNVLTGHMYGNIAQVSVVLSTLMGGVSGSANADAAMESRILGPAMIKRGYARGYGAAINGLSSLIVATIPPSMGLIMYGAIGEVSIGRLFIAGFIPGIFMMVALSVAVSITAKRYGYAPEHPHPASLKEIWKAILSSFWALIFPILLIVLIRFGIMTPSESGAFAAVYAIIIGAFVYKELNWQNFKKTLIDSTKDTAVVMLIVALAGTFGYGLVYDRVPQILVELLIGITSNKMVLYWILIAFLLVCGMFMETTVVTLLCTPILVPVIKDVGIDPVHFGLIMMTTVTTGIMTPPVGIALYTTSSIMGCSVDETAKYSLPFFVAIAAVIVFMVFCPNIILWLPNLIYG